MKKITRSISMVFFCVLMSQLSMAQNQDILEKKWESQAIYKTPESVLFHENGNIIYVANINGKPTDKDGNGFISKVSSDGELIELEWVTGLNAPKGMGIFEDKLYVTDIDKIAEIDLNKGVILNRYTVDQAKFLNDITIDESGIVYISDMQTHKIHTLEKGEISTWLEGKPLQSPNGLLYHDGKLIVGCNEILSIDIKSKEIEVLVEKMQYGVDGIVMDRNDRIFFSNWSGRIYMLDKNNKTIELLNTVDQNIQSADIGIIARESILLVPTFFDNRVVGYEIEY